jgi:hypothetical protein
MAAAGTLTALEVLQHRAEARAILFLNCDEYESFEEATADLFKWALAKGLTDQIGAAGVFDVIDVAFQKVYAHG